MAALANDWDAAIEEWRKGYIRAWMTRGVVGGTFERTVDRMDGEELFKFEPERQGQCDWPAIHPSASLRRRCRNVDLMRVFSIMDPHWKPSYRGMPLEHKETIGAWCRTNQQERPRTLVHRCLTHGVLLAHPKKFAHSLHKRTIAECQIYGMHISTRLDAEEIVPYDQTTELVMFRVFSILVGARTTQELLVQARQDEQAMKVRWFSELVDQADMSAGCALALKVLAPKAQQERSRLVAKTWFWACCLRGDDRSFMELLISNF